MFNRWINGNGPLRFSDFELWSFDLFEIDFEGSNKGGLGEKIGSVIHAVEFIV